MPKSYAVTWSENGEPPCPGRLELDVGTLRFEGGSASSPHVRAAVPYGDIVSLHLARNTSGSRDLGSVIRLKRRSARGIEISSVLSVGALHELARRLAAELADGQ